MPIADEVVVQLEAKNKQYIADLEAAQKKFNEHQNNILKKAGMGTPEFQKAQKKKVDSHKKAVTQISRQQKKVDDVIKSSSAKQARDVKGSVKSISESLKKQRDAQDKTANNAGKFSSAIKKSFAPLAAAVSAGLLVGITNEALDYAAAIERGANISGVSSERFQEMTFAADRFGISQEKLSDILKDVNDRVADFNATGGGPLLDFMEQIAPKVGLAADAFQGLSSDQSLGLFVKSLEDAGANQADFTFFLESLSSDSTALLPLLRNNGKEMGRLSDQARKLGIVLNGDAVKAANEANIALETLGDVIGGTVRGAIIQAAPEIERFTQNLIDAAPAIQSWFANLAKAANDAADGFAFAFSKMEKIRASFAIAQTSGLGLAKEFLDNTRTVAELEAAAAKVAEKQAALGEKRLKIAQKIGETNFLGLKNDFVKEAKIKSINEELEALGEKRARILKQINDVQEKPSGVATSGPLDVATKKPAGGVVQEKTRSSAAGQLERQIKAIEELGRSEREQINELLALRLDAIEKSKRAESDKADLRQKAHDAAAADIAELNDKERKSEQDRLDAIEDAGIEQFNNEQDRLDAIAEIQAAVLRMSGRALEAAEIEADAVRRRYEEELKLIDQLIAKKGLTPELASQRAQAQAGIAGADEEQSNINAERQGALGAARNLVGGNRGEESELDSALRDIADDERARLQELEDLRAGDLENLAEFEAIKTQIVTEANAERFEIIKKSQEAALLAQVDQAQQSLSILRSNLKEGSTAQKIAARAEQAIAIGRITVSTATGVAKALEGPFPLNLINAALVGAAGAAQIAAAAAPGFKDGVVSLNGPGTTTSDSIDARLSRGESVLTADATRGNEAGLRGLNAGLSPEQAFGFNAPLVDGLGLSLPDVNIAAPNVSIPSLPNVTNSSTSSNFVGGDFVVQGNLDATTADRVMAEFRSYQQGEATRFRKMSEAHEKRTTPRSRRREIGGR